MSSFDWLHTTIKYPKSLRLRIRNFSIKANSLLFNSDSRIPILLILYNRSLRRYCSYHTFMDLA